MKTLISLLLCLLSAHVWGQCSPIVVDTRRDGIELGPAGRGVSFDVNADGFPDYVQWVRPRGDEAFLTLDRNRNGLVDDGSELFGVGTPLLEGGTAPNGFIALAQYDQPLLGGNDDGVDLACGRDLAGALDVAGHQRGRHRNARRNATARLVRAHVVRHDPEGPPLHRCCRQLVAVLGMGRQHSARTGNHGRCLLPAARPDAHSPGTGKRRHSVRTAARSSSSFAVLE